MFLCVIVNVHFIFCIGYRCNQCGKTYKHPSRLSRHRHCDHRAITERVNGEKRENGRFTEKFARFCFSQWTETDCNF
jgi:DNA-directed RNA polymerase subunit RPC12/RpoP